MKHVYIHTYLLGATDVMPWRVYEGIQIGEVNDEALLLIVDERNATHTVRERHISKRNSAGWFVYANEFDLAYRDVQEDWNARHCWRECWDDVQRIKKERDAIVEACRSCGSITGGGNICAPCSIDAGNFE